MKQFLLKDVSGRNYSAIRTEEQITEYFDVNEEDIDSDRTLGEFIEFADAGTEFMLSEATLIIKLD